MVTESRLRQLMQHGLDVLTVCREILSLDADPTPDMLDRLRSSVDDLRQISVKKDDPDREAFTVAAVVNYMIGATPFSSGHVAMWKFGEYLLNRIEQDGDRLSDQERVALGVEASGLGAQLERERAQIKAADAKPAETVEISTVLGENLSIPDPDETLVRTLRGCQRPILVYLWKRGNVTRDELRKAVWIEKTITDKGIDKAVERLNTRLYELKHSLTSVESNGGIYYLKHPQK